MDMDSVFTVAFEAVRDVSWNGIRERKRSTRGTGDTRALQADLSSTPEQAR
jgi:hypothetical protein